MNDPSSVRKHNSVMAALSMLFLLTTLSTLKCGDAFSSPVATMNKRRVAASRLNMFFANQQEEQPKQEEPATVAATEPPSSTSTPKIDVQLVSTDDENFLNMVGFFLVDAFWLNSEHHQIGASAAEDISDDAKTNLCIEQASDLNDKYGEILGTRLLDSCVVAAFDKATNQIAGVVTFKVTLLNQELNKVVESEKAEVVLKNAVASLGPKQRRQYKNANVKTICEELLVENSDMRQMKPICVLSNLAISKDARRQGIAQLLCEQAEAIVKEDFGYNELYLLVEKDNVAAKTLYESKLGYTQVGAEENAVALRADIETGEFIEIEADTLILKKDL